MTPKQSRCVRATSVALLTALAAFSSGCASILHGGQRSVTVSSQPAGAKVTISKANTGEAVHSGNTPLTVMLSPKGGYFHGQSYSVKIEAIGYRPAEVTISPQLSGWYFGNIVFGGLIGMLVVDPLTGAMWNLTPDKIDRTLTAQQAELIREKKGFMVVLLADTSEVERANMVRVN